MKVIITMAGQGSRFRKEGIDKPKHEIIANGRPLFEWSLMTLSDFFDEDFVLLVRKNNYNRNKLEQSLHKLGVEHFEFVEIDELTDGQGRTVLAAEPFMQSDDDFVIYNIDTYIKNDVIKKNEIHSYDGFLPLFIAEGSQWSFAKIDPSTDQIIELAEKKRISNLGTIGLYYFGNWGIYKAIVEQYADAIKSEFKELYIAPMYNYLINQNLKIGYSVIENKEIVNLGTPAEVVEFDADFLVNNI